MRYVVFAVAKGHKIVEGDPVGGIAYDDQIRAIEKAREYAKDGWSVSSVYTRAAEIRLQEVPIIVIQDESVAVEWKLS